VPNLLFQYDNGWEVIETSDIDDENDPGRTGDGPTVVAWRDLEARDGARSFFATGASPSMCDRGGSLT
jgi:hypothetical protein